MSVGIPPPIDTVSSKSHPVCHDPRMLLESMTTTQLQSRCYPSDFSLAKVADSSVVTSLDEAHSIPSADLMDLQTKSDYWSPLVARRTVSRQGRDSQRWDSEHAAIRLVTGAVPILADGSILMVSSCKKVEWILPKGGWEVDECLEESALREVFEEAGCMGVLGPPLRPVLYERRKAKKIRLAAAAEKENTVAPFAMEVDGLVSPYSSGLFVTPLPFSNASIDSSEVSLATMETSSSLPSSSSLSTIISPDHHHNKTAGAAAAGTESKQQYTHIRMILFPLYVKQVKDTWPERGRRRKAVTIDEAIAAQANRPEFQSILQQVKEKNLHLVPGAVATYPVSH